MMVGDQKKDVKMFKSKARDADDADVGSFASSQLAAFQKAPGPRAEPDREVHGRTARAEIETGQAIATWSVFLIRFGSSACLHQAVKAVDLVLRPDISGGQLSRRFGERPDHGVVEQLMLEAEALRQIRDPEGAVALATLRVQRRSGEDNLQPSRRGKPQPKPGGPPLTFGYRVSYRPTGRTACGRFPFGNSRRRTIRTMPVLHRLPRASAT